MLISSLFISVGLRFSTNIETILVGTKDQMTAIVKYVRKREQFWTGNPKMMMMCHQTHSLPHPYFNVSSITIDLNPENMPAFSSSLIQKVSYYLRAMIVYHHTKIISSLDIT